MKNNNVSAEFDSKINHNAVVEGEYPKEEYEEEIENDIYLLELHKRLIQMRKDRKKAEQDENLLKNRLNLLKGEEEKVN